jgi:hypothetical protein
VAAVQSESRIRSKRIGGCCEDSEKSVWKLVVGLKVQRGFMGPVFRSCNYGRIQIDGRDIDFKNDYSWAGLKSTFGRFSMIPLWV